MGRPVQVYDDKGELVWQVEFDIYGRIRENLFNNKSFIPFRQLGQYEDKELDGLYYNRFRYYDSNTGTYISKDPIGLHGGIQLYCYVHDTNAWIDPFGLAKRGPKTGGKGPHNQTIKSWADEIISDGGTIIYGGGYEKEKLFETPGGHKSGRRPDIVWQDADGKTHWGNVGKTNAKGKPVTREILAMQDLNKIRHANGVPERVHFRSYTHPETNKKPKPKTSCHLWN